MWVAQPLSPDFRGLYGTVLQQEQQQWSEVAKTWQEESV